MAQEKGKVNAILKLVDELSPEERSLLVEQLAIDELRRKVQLGIESADRGELVPLEDAFQQLRKGARKKPST